nr:phage head-tail connector protein [uncultured Roseococcus sp.]
MTMSSILTLTDPATERKLCTVAQVKAELGIEGGGEDDALTVLITQASAAIESYCKRSLVLEGVQELFRPGRRLEEIVLARYPVVDGASIIVDGAALDATDYEIDAMAGLAWRLSGDHRIAWTARKIVVGYDAGYVLPTQGTAGTLPPDIQRACITLVTSYRQNAGRDLSVRSESAQDVGTTSWLDPRAGMEALLPQVAGLLAPYREQRL